MSALAIDLHEDVSAARDGILKFAEQEILPRHAEYQTFFEDPREMYEEDGKFSETLQSLIRDVRESSAKAGFYQMCVPEALGGGGLGHIAYYAAVSYTHLTLPTMYTV